jgi:hypothetical protein
MLIEPDWLNMLVDRGKNKGYVIQADQVWFGNRVPGHGGIDISLTGMQTWTIAVDKKDITFDWLESYRVFLDQKGYDFEAFQRPRTKTDIPSDPEFPLSISNTFRFP